MRTPYELPELYDIAFDFRDVPAEVDFCLDAARTISGREPRRVIEYACGPAWHLRECARRGKGAVGVDLSNEMIDYARTLATRENLEMGWACADMRSFIPETKCDLALNLMSSFAHLLTNDDIVSHLSCVARALTLGGVYVIQTAHPRDFFGDEPSAQKPYWTMTRDAVTVVTSWGASQQAFDPISEVDELVVQYTRIVGEKSDDFSAEIQLRRLSIQTLHALIRLHGTFRIAGLYGDFRFDRPLDISTNSPWLVAVLERI